MATPRAGGTTINFTSYPPSGASVTVKFPAYIDSISDSYNGAWDEHKDMGRADPKFMYNQYSRNISVSLKTAALESGEHDKWLKAVNNLTDMTKPKYEGGKGYNGVLCRMEMNPLYNVIGFLESVTVTIDNETPWIDKKPLYLSLDIQFRAIEDEKPNYQTRGGFLDGGFDPGVTV
jgi:hypothetical protein